MSHLEEKRDGFKSQWGFILARVGSAVGMGNIWRFPYMVAAWGRIWMPSAGCSDLLLQHGEIISG